MKRREKLTHLPVFYRHLIRSILYRLPHLVCATHLTYLLSPAISSIYSPPATSTKSLLSSRLPLTLLRLSQSLLHLSITRFHTFPCFPISSSTQTLLFLYIFSLSLSFILFFILIFYHSYPSLQTEDRITWYENCTNVPLSLLKQHILKPL